MPYHDPHPPRPHLRIKKSAGVAGRQKRRSSKSSSLLCRSPKSSDRLCRSATMPVGGCTPDRNDPPPPSICLGSHSLPSTAGAQRVRPGFTGRQQRRSGIASPTGTIHPRKSREADSPPKKKPLSRSGVEPPTGTIHPRKGNEAESPLASRSTPPPQKKPPPNSKKTTKLRYPPEPPTPKKKPQKPPQPK